MAVRIKIILFAAMCLGLFCFTGDSARGQVSPQQPVVLVVKSEFRAEYEQATDALTALLRANSFAIREATLNVGSDEAFWEDIYRNPPDIVVTVGTTATRSAMVYPRQVPIVFTMVLDHFADVLSSPPLRNSRITGVTLSIPDEEQFRFIRETMPFARRVGWLYSANSSTIRSVQNLAEEFDMQLVPYEISSERDIPNGLREILPSIDVFWMPPDAIIYSDSNILRLVLRECFVNNVPIFAVSKHLAVAGTAFALGIDYEDIGKQTADLVIKTLSNRYTGTNTIETPRRVELYMNRRVVSGLGLAIPTRVIDSAIPAESE
jgi:putative ABC transport system substrate-binding protein